MAFSRHHRLSKLAGTAVVLLACTLWAGCSPRKMAVNAVAGALAGGTSVFAQDDDLELVGEALPFALKTIEALLEEAPENRDLLLSACSGFTQYAYAFVEAEAFFVEPEDFRRARELRERAMKLYLRARDYCLRGLTTEHPGIREALVRRPEEAAASLGRDDLELAYWTAAAWGAAISLGQDRPELTADLPAVKSLLERALVLDESFGDGALQEAMISLAALPEALGGSEEKARKHFQRAVELSGGRSAGPYVTLARTVSVANQDRAEFERLLGSALEIDVDLEVSRDHRLANVLAQRQAQELLRRADDYFYASEEDRESPPGERDPP